MQGLGLAARMSLSRIRLGLGSIIEEETSLPATKKSLLYSILICFFSHNGSLVEVNKVAIDVMTSKDMVE